MKRVSDVLAHKGNDVYWIEPLASVYDALSLMKEKNCGALCVMIDEYLVGIISERDYLHKVILDNQASKLTKVSEIMTHDPIRVTPDDELEHCIELMYKHRFRHLPVVVEGRVVGVISLRDMFVEMIDAARR